MELRIVTEPQQGASYPALLAAATAAEALGYAGFSCSDHYLWDPDLKTGSPALPPGPKDAWITLAGLARETRRIRLGTLVSPVTFRHPAALAIQAAQVNAMSAGRVDLGLGSGWFLPEHTAYGIPFPEDRLALLEEQLAVITGLWALKDDAVFHHVGTRYRLEGAPAVIGAGRQPPPIVIGGTGPHRTPRLAARYAADFNVPYRTAEESAESFARVDEACLAIGRKPESLVHSVAQLLCCGRDEREVRRRAAAIGADADAGGGGGQAGGLVGTVDQVVEQLGRFAEIGAERVYLQVLDLADLDHLELVSREVGRQVAGL